MESSSKVSDLVNVDAMTGVGIVVCLTGVAVVACLRGVALVVCLTGVASVVCLNGVSLVILTLKWKRLKSASGMSGMKSSDLFNPGDIPKRTP